MMDVLLAQIRDCQHCTEHLPLGPRPVVAAHPDARIAIIGQAPGTRVHRTGIPWDDPSGKQLRKWMGVSDKIFYSPQWIALVPMGFCYPGKGRSGDLPPRPECAPLWHPSLWDRMPRLELLLTIGAYSHNYYLRDLQKRNLTETVRNYQDYLPRFFPLPHPSPRNRFWLSKNPWFESEVIPHLQSKVKEVLGL